MQNITEISGIVDRGLRHSSGYDENGKAFRFYGSNVGSIKSQRSFFEKIIPEFSEIYNGSINVSIHPKRFDIVEFDYEINCKWDPNRRAENFWFVNTAIIHKNNSYKGYVYYPCPSEWKKRKENNNLSCFKKIFGIKIWFCIFVKVYI